ncbi:uncharacterized protein SCHCODRAFT_02272720 [Schizophyllum commune H4-8]|uniref:uncharacterized protein n=1 Tax=Schizophyllum commune (strain H4-8 / FGSC 9210) TaxID=578458 RepID=UPI0021609133|nr:uncharacterized protein SCHCODRAFT_02272720 [Schizophyllum commune H4-8]KAI5894264.1 hypothetical protein SCHCODRAFT_02272720 [Schizophyllum commune H4-8]
MYTICTKNRRLCSDRQRRTIRVYFDLLELALLLRSLTNIVRPRPPQIHLPACARASCRRLVAGLCASWSIHVPSPTSMMVI